LLELRSKRSKLYRPAFSFLMHSTEEDFSATMRPDLNSCFEDDDSPEDGSFQRLAVHVDLSFKDTLVSALQVFLYRARTGIILYLVVTVGLFLLTTLYERAEFITAATAASVVALLMSALTAVLIYRNAKLEFSKAASGVHIMQYRFDADGVLIETLERPGWFEWGSFENFLEVRSYFLLFRNSHQCYVIPKRSLSRLEEVNNLRAMLDRHIGKNAVKQPK